MGGAPAILNTCIAYGTDSPVVQRRWPQLYTGPIDEVLPAAEQSDRELGPYAAWRVSTERAAIKRAVVGRLVAGLDCGLPEILQHEYPYGAGTPPLWPTLRSGGPAG